MLASYKAGITEKFYPTHADLLKDLAEIARDEVEWLVSEGVDYIQFDARTTLIILTRDSVNDEASRPRPDKEFENAIAGDNDALQGVPRGSVTLALHVCRGNSRSAGTRKADTTPSLKNFSEFWM